MCLVSGCGFVAALQVLYNGVRIEEGLIWRLISNKNNLSLDTQILVSRRYVIPYLLLEVEVTRLR